MEQRGAAGSNIIQGLINLVGVCFKYLRLPSSGSTAATVGRTPTHQPWMKAHGDQWQMRFAGVISDACWALGNLAQTAAGRRVIAASEHFTPIFRQLSQVIDPSSVNTVRALVFSVGFVYCCPSLISCHCCVCECECGCVYVCMFGNFDRLQGTGLTEVTINVSAPALLSHSLDVFTCVCFSANCRRCCVFDECVHGGVANSNQTFQVSCFCFS